MMDNKERQKMLFEVLGEH
jgi:hypothetical protein